LGADLTPVVAIAQVRAAAGSRHTNSPLLLAVGVITLGIGLFQA
jgi:hypothetical protein